jgi:hypothetical protein
LRIRVAAIKGIGRLSSVDNNFLGMQNKYFYSNQDTGKVCVDRRSGSDRRDRGMISALFSAGNRRRKRAGRRKTDRGGYVDVYDSRTMVVAISILALSLMDAILTSLHLLRGSASELNPVMNAVINYGGLPAFFGVKAMMTILPVAIIVLHKEWALGRYAARLILWSYILLSIYHVYLIIGVQRIAAAVHPAQ